MKILRYAANGEVKHGVLDPDDSIRESVGSPFGMLGDGSASCGAR